MTNQKPILIYGSREFFPVVHELVNACGYQFCGLIDDIYNDKEEIIGTFEQVTISHPADRYSIALAIGYKNLALRRIIYAKVKAAGYLLPNLIHPSAIVHNSVEIKEGNMLMAGVIVDISAQIGPISVLWPKVLVNHNSIIGSNTFLSPGVTVCGSSFVGNDSFIGAGAIITDHVNLPAGCFIRAGEVVHKNSLLKSYKP